MKWEIIYAIERVVLVEAENINDAPEEADRGKRKGERVVGIRTSGYQN